MQRSVWSRKLLLALGAVLVAQLFAVAGAQAAPAEAGGCFWYTVRWGDSLGSISARYGDTVWGLQSRNGISNSNFIRAGQTFQVCQAGAPRHWGGGAIHVVRWGETLTSIAQMYGTSSWALASMNGIWNPALIYAGQSIRVR